MLGLFVVLLTVIRENPNQIKSVTYKDSFDLFVKWARAAKRGRYINLKEPGLEL